MGKRISPQVSTALALGIGAILCSVIWTRALVRAKRGDDMIRVVGSARKPIHADFIIWQGSVTENAPTVAQGYANLKAKMAQVRAYLQQKGIAAADIAPSAIGVETLYAKPKPGPNGVVTPDGENTLRAAAGYRLSQSVEISSHQVDLVERVSRQEIGRASCRERVSVLV